MTGAGALLLFVALFLPWYAIAGGERTKFLLLAGGKQVPATGTAWHAYATVIFVLLALVIAALALVALAAAGRTDTLPSGAQLLAAFGLLVSALIAYKILVPPGGAQRKFNDVEYGAYLGFAGALLITLGAFLATGVSERSRAMSAPAPRPPASV